MNELVSRFLEYGEKQLGYSPWTLKSYGANLRRFAAWLGPADVSGFTVENVRTYLIERERGELRPRSVRALQSGFRAFGAWLVETEQIPTNPAMAVKRPRLDEAIVRAASEEEAAALLDGCSRLKDPIRCALARAVLSVFLFTGVRRAELVALELSDADLLGKRLLVKNGKGNKSREIPMNGELVEALTEWLAVRRAPACNHALFLSRPTHPLSSCAITGLLEELRIAAALRGRAYLRPHAFRRYFATNMSRRGVSLATISKLMGHSSIGITCQYLMTAEDELKAAVEMTVPRPATERPALRTLNGGTPERKRPTGPRVSIRLRAS
jgi:site-specific recombinase XerD